MKAFLKSFILVLCLWLIFLVLGSKQVEYGINPRNLSTLKNIFIAPFLHYNIQHLLANTIPIFVLTFFLNISYKSKALFIYFFITILASFLLWLLGRAEKDNILLYHLGASISVFGLLGFLIFKGIIEKTFIDILISLITVFIYGSTIWGILPTQKPVSWEGHFFGFITGILAAFLFKKRKLKY